MLGAGLRVAHLVRSFSLLLWHLERLVKPSAVVNVVSGAGAVRRQKRLFSEGWRFFARNGTDIDRSFVVCCHLLPRLKMFLTLLFLHSVAPFLRFLGLLALARGGDRAFGQEVDVIVIVRHSGHLDHLVIATSLAVGAAYVGLQDALIDIYLTEVAIAGKL